MPLYFIFLLAHKREVDVKWIDIVMIWNWKFFSSIYMPRKQRKMIWHYILLFHSSAIPIQKNFSQSFWRFMNEYSSAKILMAWPFLKVTKKLARIRFQSYNFVGKNVLVGVFAAILKRRWSYYKDICTINIKSLIERQCPKRLNSMHFKSTGFNINKDGPKRMKSLMIDDKCSLKKWKILAILKDLSIRNRRLKRDRFYWWEWLTSSYYHSSPHVQITKAENTSNYFQTIPYG